MEIEQRIRTDIDRFHQRVSKVRDLKLKGEEKQIVELAGMYASDSESWLGKKDFYTSFGCISYAHGLLDAILKMRLALE